MGHPLIWSWIKTAWREHPWHVVTLLALGLLSSLADGLSISLLIPLLSILFDASSIVVDSTGWLGEFLFSVANVAGPAYRLEVIATLIVVLVAVRAVLTFCDGQISGWLSGRLSHNMQARIHRNLLHVDYKFIHLTEYGRLINTLDGETARVNGAVFAIFRLFTHICMILAFTTVLLAISWRLTLVVLVLVGAVSLLRRLIDKRSRELGEQSVEAAEELSVRAYELLDSMRMTRAFGREQFAQKRYEETSERSIRLGLANDRLDGAAGAVQEVLYATIVAVLLLLAVRLQIGEASLIAFLALLHRLQPHIGALDATRTHVIHTAASCDAVAQLLDLPPWVPPAAERRSLPDLGDGIRFNDVHFSYLGRLRERRNALDGVTLHIPIGKTTALVGESGAGKSTITDLLFRFMDPDSGTITVNGVPLDRLDLAWWRSRLTIAGQDADLVSASLRQNIAFARPDADMAEIEHVARAAGIHDFIMTLPHGYDTEVGERGVLLSGGQRQRIELARALLRTDSILILDEATNALDSITEAEVLNALDEYKIARTVLVIAHRLSTTRNADQVIVLSKGRVVEHGRPGDLYEADGLFAKMVRLQELSYIVNDATAAD